MKVYFKPDGYGFDDGEQFTHYTIFIKPNGRGRAFHYDHCNELNEFSWAYADGAFAIEHKELPKELWFSILWGTYSIRLNNKHEQTFENLLKYGKYRKVKESDVEGIKQIKKLNLKTEEDIAANYELLSSNLIPYSVMERIMKIIPCDNCIQYMADKGRMDWIINNVMGIILKYLRYRYIEEPRLKNM
jgi:hypothetical protein